MNAWLPQASYPCGNCSDYSSWIFLRPQGSIGHVFRVIRSLRLLMLLSEYIQGILIPISNCKLLLGTVYNRLTGRLTGNRFIWTGKRNRTEPNRTGVILILGYSKTHMYSFYYDVLKPKYDDKIKLVYTDTDKMEKERRTIERDRGRRWWWWWDDEMMMMMMMMMTMMMMMMMMVMMMIRKRIPQENSYIGSAAVDHGSLEQFCLSNWPDWIHREWAGLGVILGGLVFSYITA